MKKIKLLSFLFAGLFIITGYAFADNNTFPLSGRAGIGTTTPQRLLHLSGGGSPSQAILFTSDFTENSTTDGTYIGTASDNDFQFWNFESGYMRFGTSSTERMRIDSSGKVGIGTTNPQRPLHLSGGAYDHQAIQFTSNSIGNTNGDGTTIGVVSGNDFQLWNWESGYIRFGTNSSERMRIDSSGKVGIGTANPQRPLHLSGGAYDHQAIQFTSNSIGNTNGDGTTIGVVSGNDFQLWNWESGYIRFGTSSSERMRIDSSGNVGIGTGVPSYPLEVNGEIMTKGIRLPNSLPPNPTYVGSEGNYISFGHPGVSEDFIGYKNNTFYMMDSEGGGDVSHPNLVVGGTIKAQEIIVDATPWADYVFEEDYKLPPLTEVEQHIKENKHLPGIPSAREVKKNGIAMSDMMAKQMQKIEELTLYMIEMKKENEELRKVNNDLLARMDKLEKSN